MNLQTIFSTVCNMTITAAVVIVCVLLARMALKKAPRGFACALWAVVLFRFLCPVSVSAPVSVLTVVDAPKTQTTVGTVVYVESPVQAPVETIRVDPSQSVEPAPSAPVAEVLIDWHLIASRVWAAGVILLAAYGIVSYVNLKRKLGESIPIGPGLREADGIKSPFLLGLLRPVIYLPSGLGPEDRGPILLHEQCHLRHGDHLVKAAFWLAVCIHWFNPLAWLAFTLCGRDMEMRCDEAVLQSLGPQIRSDYAQALLNFATGRRMAPAPLAFGEGDTGKRVKHVLSWKQKAAWALIPAAILCAVVLLITAVNPGGSIFDESPFGHSYRMGSVRASSEKPAAIDGDTLYTLTSDMGLFVRSAQTEQVGFFQKTSADWEDIQSMPEFMKQGDLRRSWRILEHEWWLLELEDGTLWLYDGFACVMYQLERTDLLGVTIKQPGVDAYVEPVWYQANSPDWYSGNLSATLVNGDAQIILLPEKVVDSIMVSEEYFMRNWDDSHSIIYGDYVLERNANGEFVLDVSRRGDVGDDHAYYHVQVDGDSYMFLLSFPAVPGETSYEAVLEEETREVSFSESGAYITLQLPESWEYSITSLTAEEIDAGIAGGITFWPRGKSEGTLFFGYYPDRFGVCGTGLKSGSMSVAGRTAEVGTYDDHSLWDFISFGEYFAIWGQGHEAWWAEYGEQAMEILDSADFGMTQGVDLDGLDLENATYCPVIPSEP